MPSDLPFVVAFRGDAPVVTGSGSQILHYEETDPIRKRTALTICQKIRSQNNHRVFSASPVQKESLPLCAVCRKRAEA